MLRRPPLFPLFPYTTLFRSLDSDVLGGLLEGRTVGSREEQDWFFFMAYFPTLPRQHRLVVPDEVDHVVARDVVSRHENDAGSPPVVRRVERYGPDGPAGDRRTDGLPVPCARCHEIVGIARFPGDFGSAIPTRDRTADSGYHVE